MRRFALLLLAVVAIVLAILYGLDPFEAPPVAPSPDAPREDGGPAGVELGRDVPEDLPPPVDLSKADRERDLTAGRTVTGRVTDARTGQPIAGARVGAGPLLDRAVETDE
ncbi:MAG: hypothetical protein ACYS99_13960, partial [Planctomycetota bacterium]